jgi:feruloyl esterase
MVRMKNAVLLGALVCSALVLIVAPLAHGQARNDAATGIAPAKSCAELVKLQIPGSGMAITKAQPVPTAPPGTVRPSPFSPETVPVAIPSYCRADGVIDPRAGVDGKPYAIGFAIALPDNWNGRFLFQGGGGLNGSVTPPLGAQATGDIPALARGFAIVSTDTGHKGAVFDASFMKDQQASLDFAQVAVGRVAFLAKEIIAQYYGQPAKHSYWAGCSTGGREGMLMSQRYPTYFDGIVAGDPAMRTGYSNLGLGWAAVAFNEIAPKDASGKPMPSQDFSAGDKKILTDALLAACDANDGLKDGMIFNPLACHFDPAVLVCKGAKTDACLSSDQVSALQKAFGGPKDSRGNQVYSPFPYDTGMINGAPGAFSNFLPSTGPNPLGPPNLAVSIGVDQRAAAVAGDAMQMLTDTATWTNLTTFSGRGGKLLFFHGESDPIFSPFDTLAYYERMAKDNGGVNQVQGWSRFFFVPGMGHCAGGPATLDKFDLLGAVVNWVEQGAAPGSVVATGRAFPGRSRPLCAYPKHAQYKGQGNPEDAASFECRE